MAEKQNNIVYLTNEEVEVWKWCWKQYDTFKVAKDMKNSKLILNLDSNGDAKPEFHFFKKGDIDNVFQHNIIK